VNLLCPTRLDPEDEIFRPRLHAALVESLYKQSWFALSGLSIVLVLLWIITREAIARSPMLGWFFVLLGCVVAFRIVWLIVLSLSPARFPSVAARHLCFLAGSTLTSACFVALNILALPLLAPIQLALFCICVAGIGTSGVATMSASPLAFGLYMPPMVISLVAMGVFHPLPVLPGVFVLLLLSYIFTQESVNLVLHRTLCENVLMHLKQEEMARRDALTGLRNRRYLQEFMEEEISRVLRAWHPENASGGLTGRSLALMMLDLDHFKAVNDTHGHAAGDAILQQVASLLKETLRKPDLVVRWGGEEFVILMLDVARTMPMLAAERIREAVEGHTFRLPSGELLKQTCSIGYAQYPFLPGQPEALDWEQVLTLADGGLYQAKHSGRNRAVGVTAGQAPGAQIEASLQDVKDSFKDKVAADILRLV
jgi:diguanylate cyclase (GGDEF)-like protein